MKTRSHCSRCDEKTIYYREYSGEGFCGKHFTKNIEKKVYKEIKKYIHNDMNVGIGVSGGKDSLVLSHILKKIITKYHGTEMMAIIVNEGIENYRNDGVDIAKKTLEKIGINYSVTNFQDTFQVTTDNWVIDANSSNTACTFCGVLRRRALELEVKKHNLDILLTGHNADDLAQTILMNVILGNHKSLLSLHKLPGMVQREKPLKNILEREIILYAYLNDIDYHSQPCPNTVNTLRNDVRNFLALTERKRAGIIYSIMSMGEKLSEINSDIKSVVNICEKCGYPSSNKICRSCSLINSLVNQ